MNPNIHAGSLHLRRSLMNCLMSPLSVTHFIPEGIFPFSIRLYLLCEQYLPYGLAGVFFSKRLYHQLREVYWASWIRTNEMQESKSCAFPLGDSPELQRYKNRYYARIYLCKCGGICQIVEKLEINNNYKMKFTAAMLY